MSRPASIVADDVASRARGVEAYLKKIEQLYANGKLTTRDVERAYTGGYLEFHAFAERSIERLFVGLLRGRFTTSMPGVRPLITVQSDAVAARIVLSERSFADWLPYDRYTERRAKAFFSCGRPFTELASPEKKALERSCILRNALAHQSSSALRHFKSEFLSGMNLPPHQQNPSGYLRGTHTVGQSRMTYLMTSVVAATRALCK